MNPVRNNEQSSISNGVKKILLVTDAWAPQVNGVVRVQDAHMHTLKARGYTVAVLDPNQFKTVPTPMYPEIRLALFARRRVASMIEELEPDAIHLMTEGPLGWAARSVCMKRGIPFTTWYHTHLQLYVNVRLRGLLRPINALLKRFHSTAARTMVSTATLKRELESLGFRENIVVVPLGVDTGLFKRNPSLSLPALPKPVFVYFSRLAPEKSPEEFLKLHLPGTKLVIGDGPDRAKLEKKYGKENRFIGYKRGQELVDWLSLADVFVFPSRTETFGLVVVEALACGIPVAAHKVMGPKDIITEGKDGYLSDDLHEAALKCLDLSSADCRAKAEQYSWEHSVEAFINNLHFYRD
ncbi:MAG: glycosyltransferase family 1 protein [bacterium]|nr:glycosyltransferase family 1 protein [bacterium]